MVGGFLFCQAVRASFWNIFRWSEPWLSLLIVMWTVDMAWRQLWPLLPADMAFFADFMEHIWIGTSARRPILDQWYWNLYEATLAGLPRSYPTLQRTGELLHSYDLDIHGLKLEQSDSKWCSRLLPISSPKQLSEAGWTVEQRSQEIVDYCDNYGKKVLF